MSHVKVPKFDATIEKALLPPLNSTQKVEASRRASENNLTWKICMAYMVFQNIAWPQVTQDIKQKNIHCELGTVNKLVISEALKKLA